MDDSGAKAPPKADPKCTATHVAYEPTREEWVCPKCKAPSGEFAIDGNAEGTTDKCERLHKKDTLHCFQCGYTTTGSRFASALAKIKNLVTCPHCKGQRVVEAAKI